MTNGEQKVSQLDNVFKPTAIGKDEPVGQHLTTNDGEPDNHARSDSAYHVGYGRPPMHTRFKPGQSGNPRGRKRKKTTIVEEINKGLQSRVSVNTVDGTKRMTKMEVIVNQMLSKAMGGDLRAAKLALELTSSVAQPSDTAPDPVISVDSEQYLKELLDRHQLGEAADQAEHDVTASHDAHLSGDNAP